jgi:hypothetical protein
VHKAIWIRTMATSPARRWPSLRIARKRKKGRAACWSIATCSSFGYMRKHISSIYLASYINWFAICVPLHADTPCQLLPRNAEIMRHEQTSVGEQARKVTILIWEVEQTSSAGSTASIQAMQLRFMVQCSSLDGAPPAARANRRSKPLLNILKEES